MLRFRELPGGSTTRTPVRAPISGSKDLTVDECVSAWNGPDMKGVREELNPPSGSFPLETGDGKLGPQGGYSVYVGVSRIPGVYDAETPPTLCYVYFYYPKGSADGSSVVLGVPMDWSQTTYLPEGIGVATGSSTDITEAPQARQNQDGTLTLLSAATGGTS